ncbi:bifunctional 2',3'-cyclic-nucleotide 2'-phosphodiesterase/3'-nucleotidase [Ruegeria sp. HKCCD7221]|uniref:bifunctional 2',3'-cyclic-nucleotide 2'-phosphodiesterase/3'-nucleotidase n=1 Tax=Ruegeria sp. HKCCD7221 TaxID=2683009 RepID=UPI001487C0A0|nr:bifunctional 2',3'-cyclic-nucleotide 2'-phosphodiesterase/3'-nucleotidase [Ruegeria sp. HKCCD7221]
MTAQIRILATTDLHMNLTGFDYYSDAPDPSIGLSRTASLIKAARTQAQSQGHLVLLFDNGDALQGAPIGERAVAQTDSRHILMQAFDDLGYDAGGLGNHDFGFGLEVLDRIVAQATCPVICSNATRADRPASWQAHTILDRNIKMQGQDLVLKIGVFSVLPPQTAKWEAHRLQGAVSVEDILTCAHRKTRELRSGGCDLIVALAHTGLGAAEPAPNLENAVIPLAAVPEIDAIIAGHSHLTLPGSAHQGLKHVDPQRGLVHGKPVVMPGAAGSHLGIIDLTLHQKDADGWSIGNQHVELHSVSPATPAAPTEEDADLKRLFAQAHKETRLHSAKPVGETRQNLHSYFSFCAPDRGLALVAAAQAAALRPFLKGTTHEDLPVLSAVSLSKFGGRAGPRSFTDVPAGQIRLRHVNDLNIFPNEMQAVVVSGAQIRDWLEMSAGVLNQMHAGQQIDLRNSARAGYNFDILHGLSHQIDLGMPARFDAGGNLTNSSHNRVKNIRLAEHPIDDQQSFVVALNNYRASGGGHFPFVDTARQIPLPVLSIQCIVRDYVAGRLPADPLADAPRPFTLRPLSGAFAILRTSPKAQHHLAELQTYNPSVIGRDDDGFLLIRLTL